MGGIAPKFVSPGFDGMPDRIVLLPYGKFAFVEVKAPGKKPRPLQVSRHGLLQHLGFKVYLLNDMNQIGGIPVSYTHLDVYKRQEHSGIRF